MSQNQRPNNSRGQNQGGGSNKPNPTGGGGGSQRGNPNRPRSKSKKKPKQKPAHVAVDVEPVGDPKKVSKEKPTADLPKPKDTNPSPNQTSPPPPPAPQITPKNSKGSIPAKTESSTPTPASTAIKSERRESGQKESKVFPETTNSHHHGQEPDAVKKHGGLLAHRKSVTYLDSGLKPKDSHHHDFITSVLHDATTDANKISHKHKHKRGTLGADVYRIRDGSNVYKFRKFGSDGNHEDSMEDPLLFSNIMKAATFEAWKRGAHLALPSNIGVPVENSGDVMHLGNSVRQQRAAGSFDQKTAYNFLYNDMENRFYNDKRYKARARKSLADLTAGPGKRPSRKSVVEPDVNRKPITFLRKLKAIRELADHMEAKRFHKAELVKHGKLEGELLENKRTCKDAITIYLTKLHDRLRDNFRRFYLWQNDLRMIHGRYGIGIAIYFHWLRTVVTINIIQTILALAFVVFPEIYARYNVPTSILSSCPTNVLSVETCALLPSAKDEDKFSGFDPFTGRGYLQQSLFFYSGYRDTLGDPYCPAHEVFKRGFFAQTAMRFVIVVLIMFAINSIYLTLQIKQYYQTAELESKIPGLHKKQRFRTFFSSWDFSVIDPTTAATLHKNIWRGFIDAVVEADSASVKKAVPADRPCLERKLAKVYNYNKAAIIVHVTVTTLLMIIYAMAGYIMWLSLAWRMVYKAQLKGTDICNEFALIPEYILVSPTFVMSGLYLCVGFFSAFISQFESWESPVAKNFAFIARIGIYYFMTVAVIYSFFTHQARKGLLCYEDFFGNEIYRIVVLQGFIYITTTFIAYNIYVVMNRRNSAWTKPQFDPVNYTMRALYLHTISGIGFFYCPLVSLLVLVRQVITFYHHKRMLLHFYRLSGHIIQSSDVHLPFMLAYLISYLTTTAMNIAFFEFHPSTVCGPFSHYTEHHQIRTKTKEPGYYYEVFVQGFKASDNAVINVFLSPGTAFVIILFLMTLVWCLYYWGVGHLKSVQELYTFLQLERKDRDFLLEAIYHYAKKLAKEETTDEKIENRSSDVQLGNEMIRHIEESIFEGVFRHRRGSLASIKPIPVDPRSSGISTSHEHGTLGRQVKDDFHWLPSQWHRRERRAALAGAELKEGEVKLFQETYKKTIANGENISTVDDKSPVIEKTPDQIKSKNGSLSGSKNDKIIK